MSDVVGILAEEVRLSEQIVRGRRALVPRFRVITAREISLGKNF